MEKQELSTAGKRLKYIRALMRLSRSYIQEKYNLPQVTLKSWENETVPLSKAGANRCTEVYRKEGLIVSPDWILSGVGLDPAKSTDIGRYFFESSSTDLPLEDDELCMLKDANLFKESYPNAVVMMVSGDEMRPFYKPGDYIGGKMRYGDSIETAVKKDCIVYLQDGSHFFRRFLKNPSGGYNLTCLNPHESISEPVMFNVAIKGVAPVIWHRTKDE